LGRQGQRLRCLTEPGGLPKTTATKLIAALALKAFLFGGSMATVAGGPMPDLVGKKR
jgi:hypothetical protein